MTQTWSWSLYLHHCTVHLAKQYCVWTILSYVIVNLEENKIPVYKKLRSVY